MDQLLGVSTRVYQETPFLRSSLYVQVEILSKSSSVLLLEAQLHIQILRIKLAILSCGELFKRIWNVEATHLQPYLHIISRSNFPNKNFSFHGLF